MDFEYSSEQKLLRDSVRKLMQRIATPDYLRRFDRERLYPYELYDAWVEAGLFALPFAPEYGGLQRARSRHRLRGNRPLQRRRGNSFGVSIFCSLNVSRKGWRSKSDIGCRN